MPLEVVTQPPYGPVWENSDWDQSKPGTFAVVIGVSKYDHLPKDKVECDQEKKKEEDKQKFYGLCQLYVSALTAYRFFCWLKEKYRHPHLPLAKVWLLLAPTDTEIQQMPDLPQNSFRQPTFLNCKAAIGEWFTCINTLHPFVSEKSRTLFFFSGHGLEVGGKQILLPSDYLEPPGLPDWALSTYNLWTGMKATPVPEHFFFLDACRNDHEKLKGLGIEGTQVLPPCLHARTDAISPIVYATGPGAAAWAPENPQQGISIFGRALVECLECHEGVGAWQDTQQRYWITFRQLEDYLEPRVAQLLQGAGLRTNQPVKISEAVGRRPICQVEPPLAKRGFRRGMKPADALPTLDRVALPQGWRGPDDSWKSTYNIVQDKSMTELLCKAKIYDLSTREWTDIQKAVAREALTVQAIARTEDTYTYTIEVETRLPSPQWLEFVSPNNQKAASLLLGDEYDHSRYTLRFDFMDQPSGRVIAGLDVSLASLNEGVLGEAAKLWNQYRWSDVGEEATPAEFALLERLLLGKVESPPAATAAALLLLRGWRPDLLHNWLKNLATWFPERPDGWVIWVEQLLRTKQEKGLEEAVTAFLTLEQLPLPLTSEGLIHASRQVGELLQFAFPAPEHQTNEQRRRHEALKKLQQRLNRALAVHRSGGFCAVFIGRKEAVTPDLILPA